MAARSDRDIARGRYLQSLRQEAGLEQQDIADALEVSRVTVSRWETGTTEIKRSVVRELVMLYMAHGAVPDPAEATEAGVEIPRRTAERAPGETAYKTPDVINAPTVREVSPAELATWGQQETARNLQRLAEIRGQALGVLRMLEAVTAEQQRVVDSLDPWAVRESELRASGLDDDEVASVLAAFADSPTPTVPSAPAGVPKVAGTKKTARG